MIQTQLSRRNFLKVAGLSLGTAAAACSGLGYLAARRAYVDGVRRLLPSSENVYFTGRMDCSRLSFADRLIARMVKAVESDQRDWDAIRRWAETVLA